MSKLTHFDGDGHAHMVDVSDKPVTTRIARAEGLVTMAPETLALITELGEAMKHCTIAQRVLLDMAEQRRKRKLKLAN